MNQGDGGGNEDNRVRIDVEDDGGKVMKNAPKRPVRIMNLGGPIPGTAGEESREARGGIALLGA